MFQFYFVQVCYNNSRAYPVAYHFEWYIIGTVVPFALLHLPGLERDFARSEVSCNHYQQLHYYVS